MDKDQLASRLGFHEMFPETKPQKVADEPSGETQAATEEVKEETSESSSEKTSDAAAQEAAQETSANEEKEAEPIIADEDGDDSEPEVAGEGDDKELAHPGGRAEKRIKQLSAKAKAAEDKSRQLELELAQLKGRMDQISTQPKQADQSKKTWEDLSLEELEFIEQNHPEHADKVRQARPKVYAKMAREEAERAVGQVKSEMSMREQAALAAQLAQRDYPDVAKPGSALRVLAEKIYTEAGVEDLGLSPSDLQKNPRGILIATKEAFARLARERMVGMNGKQKPKANVPLESGRGAVSPTAKDSPVDKKAALKDYVNKKKSLKDVLASRGVGAGLPND